VDAVSAGFGTRFKASGVRFQREPDPDSGVVILPYEESLSATRYSYV
jgi:hypothetical protein